MAFQCLPKDAMRDVLPHVGVSLEEFFHAFRDRVSPLRCARGVSRLSGLPRSCSFELRHGAVETVSSVADLQWRGCVSVR